MEALKGVLHDWQETAKLDQIFKIGAAIAANDDSEVLRYFKLKDDFNLKECSTLKEYDEMLAKRKILLQKLREILLMQQKLFLQGNDVELYGLIKKAKSLNGYGTSCYVNSSLQLLKKQLEQRATKEQISESLEFFKWLTNSKYKVAIFTSRFEDTSVFDIPPGLLNPKKWDNPYFDLDENTTYVLSKRAFDVSRYVHKFWLSRIFVQNGLIRLI